MGTNTFNYLENIFINHSEHHHLSYRKKYSKLTLLQSMPRIFARFLVGLKLRPLYAREHPKLIDL